MFEHLIFFDPECPLCVQAVQRIIDIDTDKRFRFASFQSHTAKNVLSGPNQRYVHMNGLILVERYQCTSRKFFSRALAALRIYWRLGHFFTFLCTWSKSLFRTRVAVHRHEYRFAPMLEVQPSERFLP
jgi:predicted DCC family thiol-disulfide oxidoreductase YuxK